MSKSKSKLATRRRVRQPHASPFFGVRFRRSAPGPELKLIEWFVKEDFLCIPKGCRASLFREPCIESRFPDMVAVIWNESVAQKWSDARSKLHKEDVRLVHYLHQQGSQSEQQLAGVVSPGLKPSLARLEEAGIAYKKNNLWRTRMLSQIFAVRQIVAIEAKVSEWSRAIEQAHLNTWFASHSYVLLPKLPRGEQLLETASRLGIGIWAKEEGRVSQASPGTDKLPRSYGSWLFNEWAWRSSDQHRFYL